MGGVAVNHTRYKTAPMLSVVSAQSNFFNVPPTSDPSLTKSSLPWQNGTFSPLCPSHTFTPKGQLPNVPGPRAHTDHNGALPSDGGPKHGQVLSDSASSTSTAPLQESFDATVPTSFAPRVRQTCTHTMTPGEGNVTAFERALVNRSTNTEGKESV